MKPQQFIFREIGGIWRRVDNQEPEPPTLAEFLEILNIIIDQDTQFARIKRATQTIEYRDFGGKVIINIWQQKSK